MKRLRRKHLITPTPTSLKGTPVEMLIMMAANRSGMLSPEGIANIAAEIKRQKDSKNQAC